MAITLTFESFLSTADVCKIADCISNMGFKCKCSFKIEPNPDIDKDLNPIYECIRKSTNQECKLSYQIEIYEIQQEILKYGITKILSMQTIMEEVLQKDNDTKENYSNILKKVIDNIVEEKQHNAFLITDPYIFPKIESKEERRKYIINVIEILKKPMEKFLKLNIITGDENKICSETQDLFIEAFDSTFQNKVKIKPSCSFHDRFWISYNDSTREGKGFFIGTSLNGIGKKYTLFDYLEENDVKEIIEICINEKLV